MAQTRYFSFNPLDKTIGNYDTYSNTETVALTARVGDKAGTMATKDVRFY
ncbi:hypothetical protein KO504_13730 [Winogradskyella psychrotolerans]|nr:hypothetical protein [Winogradskyella psychrotolerans]MBU2922409.1 hypothetical protein [Winogradskyella psychrotolerans]